MRSSAPAGSQQAADRRNRSIRLHNLPEGTQEGLLQQALEKIVPLKRLEIFASANEAVAELQDPSVSLWVSDWSDHCRRWARFC